MTNMKKLLAGTALAASIIASPAFAQSITGTLNFGALGGTNYFDPANGFVPAGFGNASGATVPIGAGVEFGFQDGANLDTADFTSTSLTISDQTLSTAGNFFMTFTSSTSGFFNNAAFASNGFGGTLSVTGNTLTFSAPTFNTVATRTAVITFAGAGAVVAGAAPEPAAWAMMLAGFGLAGVAMRRRRAATMRVTYAN